MARTLIPVNEINRQAATPPSPTAGDPTNGNYVVNNGRVFLELSNTDTVDRTATVVLPGTVDGQAVADRTYTVPAGGSLRPLGSWPTTTYSDQLQIDVNSNLVGITPYHLPSS